MAEPSSRSLPLSHLKAMNLPHVGDLAEITHRSAPPRRGNFDGAYMSMLGRILKNESTKRNEIARHSINFAFARTNSGKTVLIHPKERIQISRLRSGQNGSLLQTLFVAGIA